MKRYLPIIITLGLIFLILIVLTYWEPEKKDVLDGSIWQVDEINLQPLLEFSTLTIRFHNQKINGSSECNRFKGRYKISGEAIQLEVLERTTDDCMEPGIMHQDEEFILILEKAARFSFSGDDLKFYTVEGQELLDFVLMTE